MLNTMRRPQTTISAGFTLIELLVVVSIISLIIGLLLPVLGNARDAARGAVCLSNMRQMGIAVYGYALDFDDSLPTIGLGETGSTLDTQGAWLFVLSDYVDSDLLYRCPSDDSEFWKVLAPTTPPRLRQVSYATNNLVTTNFGPFTPPGGVNPFSKLTNIPRPTETIYSVELTEVNNAGFAVADHIHPEGWLFFGSEQIGWQVEIEQHTEKSNYLFFDGHAAQLALEETYVAGSNLFPNGATSAQLELNLYDPRLER